ncbi:MAG: peptidylprolyl isomerase [Thermodesulfobacteriota bacterium]
MLPATSLWAEEVDRIVAVVNDEVITLSELEAEVATFLRAGQAPAAGQAELRRSLLAQLVDRKLAEQKAVELGITVTDAEVDQGIAQVMARHGLNREQLERDLVRMGRDMADYRQALRLSLLQKRLVDLEVRSRVVVTDQRVAQYYQEELAAEAMEPGYHVLLLGLGWAAGEEAAAREEVRERIRGLRRQIVGGELGFREAARRFSELSSAAEGGDIGVVDPTQMAESMRKVIEALPPGEVSEPVETPGGVQLVKVLRRRVAQGLELAPLEAIQEEVRELIFQQDLQRQFGRFLEELRGKAQIRILLEG